MPYVRALYEDMDTSGTHVPEYKSHSLFKIVNGIGYKLFMSDVDYNHKVRNIPLVGRPMMEALWYKLLMRKFSEPDDFEFVRRYGIERAIQQRQSTLGWGIASVSYTSRPIILQRHKMLTCS